MMVISRDADVFDFECMLYISNYRYSDWLKKYIKWKKN